VRRHWSPERSGRSCPSSATSSTSHPVPRAREQRAPPARRGALMYPRSGYLPHPPLGGGGGWWPGQPWLLPGPPPASPKAGPTVIASAKPANMLANTLRREIFTRIPPFSPQISACCLTPRARHADAPDAIRCPGRLKSSGRISTSSPAHQVPHRIAPGSPAPTRHFSERAAQRCAACRRGLAGNRARHSWSHKCVARQDLT
jgi:hypothetical protein